MRKFILFIIISNLLVFVFPSCESEDDDFNHPRLMGSSIQDGDTFYMNANRINKFMLELSDDNRLSTAKLHFKCAAGIDTFVYEIDTVTGMPTTTIDSIAMLSRVYTFNLFGEKDVSLIDSFSLIHTYTYQSRTCTIIPGRLYELTVGYIDYAGNYDSVVYKNITLLHKK